MTNLELINYISIPIVAALIGWITNYIAVKMLFRPQLPVKFLGFKIQGLVPMRQKDLAVKIGETVEENLVSHEDVKDVLQSNEIQKEVLQLISAEIDTFLTQRLSKTIPMLGMFLNSELTEKVKVSLVAQIEHSIPKFVENLGEKIEHNLDFKLIVRKKVEEFDLGKLEEIIYSISATELKTIELLGAVLGFVVGLFQVLFLYLSK